MTPEGALVLIAGIVKEHRAKRIGDDDALCAIRALVGMRDVAPATAAAATGAPADVGDARAPAVVIPMAEVRKAIGRSSHRLPMAAANDPIDVDNPDAAMEAVMGPQLADYRKGRMDADAVQQIAEIRRDQIRDMRRQAMRPREAQDCRRCDMPATTVIGDHAYCDAHAAEAPRGEVSLEGGLE